MQLRRDGLSILCCLVHFLIALFIFKSNLTSINLTLPYVPALTLMGSSSSEEWVKIYFHLLKIKNAHRHTLHDATNPLGMVRLPFD